MVRFDFNKVEEKDYFEAYLLMKELRTNIEEEAFISILKLAVQQNNYQLISAVLENKIVGLMGYRILYDFVHGKHLYIDDLVVSEKYRSHGYGAELLKHAEQLAKEQNCVGLRLCTGIDNERGKCFYERNGWEIRAVAFKKKI